MGLLRCVCLTGTTVLYGLTITGEDDPVGAGLGSFMLTVTVAGLWALVDGWRRSFRTGAIAWVLAAALLVLLGPLPWVLSYPPAEGGWTGVSDYLSMIGDGVVFMFALVAVPALAGLGLGRLIRGAQHPTAPSTPHSDVHAH